MKDHREGCPVVRTGRCTCTYLNQWDKRPEYTAPTWPIISLDTLHDRALAEEALFKQPGTLTGSGVLVIPDEMWDDMDPAALLAPGAPQFISASEYQEQQAKAGPTPFQSHLTDVEAKPAATPGDIMAELDQLRTEMTTEDAAEISRRGTRERCTDHPYSWHFTDAMTCDQLNEELLGVGGFSELTMHPSSMVRLAAQTSNRLVKEAKQSTDIQRQRAEFHKARAKSWERNALWASILGTAGWAFSIARGVWGF